MGPTGLDLENLKNTYRTSYPSLRIKKMSKRSKGKKVAIVGFSKTSYDDVPWDNPGWEKWG